MTDTGTGAVTVPVTLASLRPVIELALTRPDGSERRALAWDNMGASAPILSKALYRDLGVDRGRALALRLGDVRIPVPRLVHDPGEIRAPLGGRRDVAGPQRASPGR